MIKRTFLSLHGFYCHESSLDVVSSEHYSPASSFSKVLDELIALELWTPDLGGAALAGSLHVLKLDALILASSLLRG